MVTEKDAKEPILRISRSKRETKRPRITSAYPAKEGWRNQEHARRLDGPPG